MGQRLRQRARNLGLSDAEVARRAGLTPTRYGHYVSDYREPDLATLLRICGVLATTPNEILAVGEESEGVQAGLKKLVGYAMAMDPRTLEIAVTVMRALAVSAPPNIVSPNPDRDTGTKLDG